jgi:putative ABC transport system permease protein
VTGKSSVAVLGANVASTLFSDVSPVGQSVRINNITFKVIGVLTAKGGTGMGNQDDMVVVPITTAMARLSRNRMGAGNVISQISVQVVDARQMDAAIEQISTVLRERHNIRYEDDFTVRSQQDMLESATAITDVLTLFLGGVAGISLLVGGIGIMNIMLVSVTERTREIGIRKAIGATRRNVLLQFLTEATILSVMGGLIGVAVGAAIANLISGVSVGTMTLQPVISMDSILLATIFSLCVGLFFGIYPAFRAAGLNPIDALHYE